MHKQAQNGSFIKKIIRSNHFLKLMFKLTYLVPRRRCVINFFFHHLVKASINNSDFIFKLSHIVN